jgi:hypothetical protein
VDSDPPERADSNKIGSMGPIGLVHGEITYCRWTCRHRLLRSWMRRSSRFRITCCYLSHHSVGREIWLLFVRSETNHLSDQEIPCFGVVNLSIVDFLNRAIATCRDCFHDNRTPPFDKRPRHVIREHSFDRRNRSLAWNRSSRCVCPDYWISFCSVFMWISVDKVANPTGDGVAWESKVYANRLHRSSVVMQMKPGQWSTGSCRVECITRTYAMKTNGKYARTFSIHALQKNCERVANVSHISVILRFQVVKYIVTQPTHYNLWFVAFLTGYHWWSARDFDLDDHQPLNISQLCRGDVVEKS